jgi:hypothetical protein
VEIKKFLGMKNTTAPNRLKPGELVAATNFDIDDTHTLLTRKGTTQVLAGNFHSLWGDEDLALLMDGNVLKRVNADHSLTTLATFMSSEPVCVAHQQAVALLSNGVDTLMLRNGEPHMWGTPSPLGQPVATQYSGNLPPGDYMYAMTFLRADGFESGTGLAGKISLPTGGGIQFSQMESSTDPAVYAKIVYIGSANGKELFRAFTVPVSAASYAYTGDGTDLTVRLETQFATAAPAGTIVDIYNGCAYSVLGDTAYYSDPYQFERFRPRTQFMSMPSAITMWASVNDGIFVGTTEAVYFLGGGHPSDMKSKRVFDYGAIPGTVVRTYAGVMESLEEDEQGEPGDMAVVWTSPHGVCIGMDGGKAVNMTGREYSFPGGVRGRGILKTARGITQYQVALEGPGAASNAYS